MKEKFQYYCNSCGYTSSKWLGRCPSCDAWSSFVEEPYFDDKSDKRFNTLASATTKPKLLNSVEINSRKSASVAFG